MKQMIYLTTAFLSMLSFASTSYANINFTKDNDDTVKLTIAHPEVGQYLSKIQFKLRDEVVLERDTLAIEQVYTIKINESNQCPQLQINVQKSGQDGFTAEVTIPGLTIEKSVKSEQTCYNPAMFGLYSEK